MRVIAAPDSFKGSLTAAEAAEAMRLGVLDARPDAAVDPCPIADGGEGTVDAMLAATGGERVLTRVTGPRGEPIDAAWAWVEPSGDGGPLAVIEMAAASGLTLLGEHERDPERTTTFGTGELIAAAVDRGAATVLLGLGGSATCDAGCGAAQALGARFFDDDDRGLTRPITGGDLANIARVDLGALNDRLRGVAVRVACDVTNPFHGPEGAARVYAPQKGAGPDAVERLDAGLRRLAAVWLEEVGVDVPSIAGAGAAGGFGGGAVAMLGGSLGRGIELVLGAVGFDRRVAGCDLCLTGEGRLDGQSLSGKAVLGVARAAARRGVATHALVGGVGAGAERALDAGLAGYRVIAEGVPVAEAMTDAGLYLRRAARAWVDEVSGNG